jgi:hypothetical protein
VYTARSAFTSSRLSLHQSPSPQISEIKTCAGIIAIF